MGPNPEIVQGFTRRQRQIHHIQGTALLVARFNPPCTPLENDNVRIAGFGCQL